MADVEHSDNLDAEDVEELEEVPDELGDDDLEAVDEPVLEDDFADEGESAPEQAEDEAVAEPSQAKAKTATRRARAGDDEEDEEDDDEEDDDVEADLDTILKDRIAAQPDDAEDEDEVAQAETEDRTDGAGRIQPRKPGEFVCQSCFLVKHPSQLADPDAMLCADCV